jgi:hypothetical protein
MSKQVTDTILMIRPVRFGYNPQTAGNNSFQNAEGSEHEQAIQAAALAEFDAFVEKLRAVGVRVLVFSDRLDAPQPDSIFPNNWLSTHDGGLVMLYPMYAPNRRAERRLDLVQALSAEHGLDVRFIVDLSANEMQKRFLEGTGSMIIDREVRSIYACLSPRTDAQLLEEYAQTFGYQLHTFDAFDQHGQPIYHTNVVMHLGSRLAVICLEALPAEQRAAVRYALDLAGKQVLEISLDQLNRFAGNMLEVRSADGQHYTVMSQQALESLGGDQRALIERYTPIIASPLNTIERFGGGSARCMMAEVFLGEGL